MELSKEESDLFLRRLNNVVCEHCKGTGRFVTMPDHTLEGQLPMILPCPVCQGSKQAYCCEGAELPCDVEEK